MWKLENFSIHWKKVESDDDSGIKEHLLFCNHTPHFEDFSVKVTLITLKSSKT